MSAAIWSPVNKTDSAFKTAPTPILEEPLLLRVFKPAIKQATAKVQKMLGKVEAKPSRNEIIADEYRKKKGLPPFKDTLKKMKKKK